MRIKEKAYVFAGHQDDMSTFRFSNIVRTPEEADVLCVSMYRFNPFMKNEVINFLKTYTRRLIRKRKIYIDGTVEIMPDILVDCLLEIENLSNITLFTAERNPEWRKKDLFELINRGLKINYDCYFLKYKEYYTPITKNLEIQPKKFLYMVGKNKFERLVLLGLLAYENLIDKYAHISFFGNHIENIKFSAGVEVNDIFTNPLLCNKTKYKVKTGLRRIDPIFKLDTKIFDREVSHNRQYNRDYYDAVDFVVVGESNFAYDDVYFPTEKVAKPIQLNKKMIVLGTKNFVSNTIKYYEKRGEDVSDLFNWCDTKYDKEDNNIKRIEKIVETIKENAVNI